MNEYISNLKTIQGGGRLWGNKLYIKNNDNRIPKREWNWERREK